MIAPKLSTLKQLVESQGGIHLTVYIENRGHIISLRKQLRNSIETAMEYLLPVMTQEEANRFVEPINKLMDDYRLLKSMKGNIGLFRTRDSFRVLSMPIQIEQTCIVAKSFHVKPLLRWIQSDKEFLVLCIGDDSASLYSGNQSTFHLIDTVLFPEGSRMLPESGEYAVLKKLRDRRIQQYKTLDWVNDMVNDLVKVDSPRLFIAGQKDLAERFLEICKYKNTYKQTIFSYSERKGTNELVGQIRSIQRMESNRLLQQSLMEFYIAEDMNLANKNIFQIAKAAIKGKVQKLIIADGINIFGKLDPKSGVIAIHPLHLDHEDDDLLDDIAQQVLAHGGEVVVAHREQIPKGRPILAILKQENIEANYRNRKVKEDASKQERRTV